MSDSTLSLESINSDTSSRSEMSDSNIWSPVKALSTSIATAFTSIMGSLDRKAGELLGIPVIDPFIDHPRAKDLTERPLVDSPRPSHNLDSEAMVAVDKRLMWHLRHSYQVWHTQSPPSSGQSTPQSRRSPLSLSMYADMVRSFLPGARAERNPRNTTAADNTLIDLLDSSFTPTLSKYGLDNESDEEDQDGL